MLHMLFNFIRIIILIKRFISFHEMKITYVLKCTVQGKNESKHQKILDMVFMKFV